MSSIFSYIIAFMENVKIPIQSPEILTLFSNYSPITAIPNPASPKWTKNTGLT